MGTEQEGRARGMVDVIRVSLTEVLSSTTLNGGCSAPAYYRKEVMTGNMRAVSFTIATITRSEMVECPMCLRVSGSTERVADSSTRQGRRGSRSSGSRRARSTKAGLSFQFRSRDFLSLTNLEFLRHDSLGVIIVWPYRAISFAGSYLPFPVL